VPDKNLFYACKLHSQQEIAIIDEDIKGDQLYGESLKPTVCISILAAQSLFKETPFVSEYVMMEKTTHHILSKKLQLFSMELPKLNGELKKCKETGTPFGAHHWWGKFFHTETEEELEALMNDEGAPTVVKEAGMTLIQVSQNDKLRALCNARETAALFDQQERAVNYQAGRADGKVEGKVEGKVTLLSKLFAKKFKTSPSVIEEIIASQDNQTLDNLGENVFSIESIEDLKGYIKQQ
jgi:chaperonin cofactor prefoldin